MNRARPTRKILLALTALIAVFALGPASQPVGGSEPQTEPQPAALATGPVDAAAPEEVPELHAQVIRGLPFSNFDLFSLMAVVIGLTTISFVVHRLNLEPEPGAGAPFTTDAK